VADDDEAEMWRHASPAFRELNARKLGRPGASPLRAAPAVPPDLTVLTPAMQRLEKVVQAQVAALAARHGWLHYHTHRSDKSERGYPDSTLIRPPRFILAELKRDGTIRPTPDQCRWLDTAADVTGIEVYLWRPADIAEIERILAEPDTGAAWAAYDDGRRLTAWHLRRTAWLT
jgi:hypothetical protein